MFGLKPREVINTYTVDLCCLYVVWFSSFEKKVHRSEMIKMNQNKRVSNLFILSRQVSFTDGPIDLPRFIYTSAPHPDILSS